MKNNFFLDFFQSEKNKTYFQKLRNKLKSEYQIKTIYPQKENIFKALENMDIKNLKVVIIGQDPYHGPNQADGYAFSTQNSILPPSLKNIFKEIQRDYPDFQKEDGDLSNWVKQGVLLLNRVLTVEQHKANSHKEWGWEIFTLNFLKTIIENKTNIIFLLLGRQAQNLNQELDLSNQIVFNLSHPSPFSYRISFENSHIFKKINDTLNQLNLQSIKW